MITKSDKGNITVAIHKDVYIQKMLHIFNDEDTFQLIPNNPTKMLQKGYKVISTINSPTRKWEELLSQIINKSIEISKTSIK